MSLQDELVGPSRTPHAPTDSSTMTKTNFVSIIVLQQACSRTGQLTAALQLHVVCMRVSFGPDSSPAGQQGWARCGVVAEGAVGTVDLLIRGR